MDLHGRNGGSFLRRSGVSGATMDRVCLPSRYPFERADYTGGKGQLCAGEFQCALVAKDAKGAIRISVVRIYGAGSGHCSSSDTGFNAAFRVSRSIVPATGRMGSAGDVGTAMAGVADPACLGCRGDYLQADRKHAFRAAVIFRGGGIGGRSESLPNPLYPLFSPDHRRGTESIFDSATDRAGLCAFAGNGLDDRNNCRSGRLHGCVFFQSPVPADTQSDAKPLSPTGAPGFGGSPSSRSRGRPTAGSATNTATKKPGIAARPKKWWSKGDLNPHASRHMTLNHACLPIPPFDQIYSAFAR